MTADAPSAGSVGVSSGGHAAGGGLPLALRLARRELRGGLKGFRIFLACLILGVAAIAGVGSVSEAMLDGLRTDGRTLLGGDLELRLYHRQASEEQQAWLSDRGNLSRSAEMRTMAQVPEAAKRRLVELRAVDGAFPLYGDLETSPATPVDQLLASENGTWGAVVDPSVRGQLGVELGGTLRIGTAVYQVRAFLEREPDKASRAFALGPTVLVAYESLTETGLIQPGSLVKYHYRLRLADPGGTAALRADLERSFPEAGWRIRDSSGAAPGVRRFIVQVSLFLTLVGLTSLLVGGVGISNAIRSYLETKTATIATLKCLGGSGRLIFQSYLAQVLALALLGVAIGLALGAGATYLVASLIGDQLGWQTQGGIYPLPLLVAGVFGLLTSLVFSLWPIARARSIPAASLFRDLIVPDHGLGLVGMLRRIGPATLAAIILAGGGLAALAILTASNRWLALWFVLGAFATLILFRLTAQGLIALARRLPRPRRVGLRLALTNLHRPGAPTGPVVMSLGLGLTVLVAISLIESNLGRSMRQSLPEEAPGFYFVDIQPYQVEEFDRLVLETPGVQELRRVPMLRGRISAVNGKGPDALDVPPDVAWVFRGDRGLTWTREPVGGARLTAGDWWPADYDGEPLVSLDADVGEALGLGPGDRLTVNVLGRPIEVTIANLRLIDWSELSLNFVLVFSPGILESAPQTQVATVKADPDVEDALELAVTDRFGNVSAIRVKEVLNSVGELIGHIGVAVRSTAGFAIAIGVLVLAGAVVAGQRRRIYDAVVLKVLGATRRDVGGAFLMEYGLLGLVTSVIALGIGSLAAYLVLTQVMELPFVFLPGAALGSAGIAVLVTLALGLGATWHALGRKAAPLLRNE